MLNGFLSINPTDVTDNVFKLIADDWMLLTAGSSDCFNTMTASWGAMGELWSRKVVFVFVRPQRHTFSFMEESKRFTLSFFPDSCRNVLDFCGSRSGRDVDKVAATGLTVVQPSKDTVAFNEARLVLVCRKIYASDLDPSFFLDDSIEQCYPESDYHRYYIGEIESVYEKS